MGCPQQGRFDFAIPQNADLNIVATYYDPNENLINLTGYTAYLEAKQSVSDENPLLILSTSNGGIILGGAEGTITLYSPAYINCLLSWVNAAYDLLLISPGNQITRLCYGTITLSEGATQLYGAPVFAFFPAICSQYLALI